MVGWRLSLVLVRAMVVRLQIQLPPVDEKKKVIEDVDKDRRYAIDASIVRIMKSRKVLGHQQLVLECVEQLSRMFRVSATGPGHSPRALTCTPLLCHHHPVVSWCSAALCSFR